MQLNGPPSSWETLPLGILSACESLKRPGETLLETATRALANEALKATGGNQKRAAQLLGIPSRVLNYICQDLQIRPIDKRRLRYSQLVQEEGLCRK
jgi:DNA-binding NtrC family response regulator